MLNPSSSFQPKQMKRSEENAKRLDSGSPCRHLLASIGIRPDVMHMQLERNNCPSERGTTDNRASHDLHSLLTRSGRKNVSYINKSRRHLIIIDDLMKREVVT